MADEKEIQDNENTGAPVPPEDLLKRAPGEPSPKAEPRERAPQKPVIMDEVGRELNTKNENKERGSSIRTYEADVERVLKSKNESVSSMVLAEQKRREEESKKIQNLEKKKTSSNLRFWPILLASILVIGGIGAITYSFLLKPGASPEVREPLPEPIIFSNQELILETDTLKKREIIISLGEIRREYKGSLGSILNVFVTLGQQENRKVLSSTEFLNRIDANAPSSLIRNLSPLMMYGVHSFSGNPGFFIFKVKSFEPVFAKMLDWERDMFSDLGEILYENPNETLFGVSTSTERSVGNIVPFTDLVIKNKDARVLKNNEGNIVLLYAFPDRETLIITTNPSTFNEILNRLTAARFE